MAKRYDPDRHHRRSIRLKGYDYKSAGAYFVTICARQRECVLDDPVISGIITDVWHALPGWFPTIALDEFVVIPNHVHFMVWLQNDVGTSLVDAPKIGSNDSGGVGVGASPTPTDSDIRPWIIPTPEKQNLHPSLGDVVGAFKSLVFTVYLDWIKGEARTGANAPPTDHDNVGAGASPAPTLRRAKFWQRNYFEHIIRNERALQTIRRYIRDNPINWALDPDNPANIGQLRPPQRIEDYLYDVENIVDDVMI